MQRQHGEVLTLPSTSKPPETAAEFLDLLEKGSGAVQIADPPERVRAAWRRFIHAVKQDGHVPAGSHLLHRGRNSGDLTIELRKGKHPCGQYRPAKATGIVVPTELRDPHPVIGRLRNEPDRLPKSPDNRSRCLMILQALAEAAQSGGDVIRAGSGECLLVIVVQDQPYGVRVREQTSARWPTGRLVLEIDGPGEGASRWGDYVHRLVEENLSEVLEAVRRRAAAAVVKQQEEAAKRKAEERKAQQQRELDWQRMIADHRDKILREQIDAWHLARAIRSHCTEMVQAGLPADSEWLAWASTYAEDIDPLNDPPGLPDDPDPRLQHLRVLQQQQLAREGRYDLPEPRPWHPNQRWYHR
jgi:hypothetical protein